MSDVGFEVCRAPTSSFINLLYRAGFDEHFASWVRTETTKTSDGSALWRRVGALWELCLQHESAVPEVLATSAIDASILKDQVLIASARATCCEVWLEAFRRRGFGGGNDPDGESGPVAYLQIVEWVLEASDRLILSRQFSALSLLLEKVDMAPVFGAVDRVTAQDGQDSDRQASGVKGLQVLSPGHQDGLTYELEDVDAEAVEMRWRCVVLTIKMLLYEAYAAVQSKSAMSPTDRMREAASEAREYLDRVKGGQPQIYCESEFLASALRLVSLLLQEEELDVAGGLLGELWIISSRLCDKDENLGREWEKRIMVSSVWCGLTSCLGQRREYVTDGIYSLLMESLKSLGDVEDLDPDLDARHEASKRLDAIVRANDVDVIEALGKACAAVVPRRRGMRLVLATYAWIFQGTCLGDNQGYGIGEGVEGEGGGLDGMRTASAAVSSGMGVPPDAFNARKIFMMSALGNLCLQFDAEYARSCPDACEVVASLLSNRIVLTAVQADVELARDLHALMWNAACDSVLDNSSRMWLLASAKTLADLTQDANAIRNALLQQAMARCRMWHFDLAWELANRATQYDASAAAIIKLEILVTKSERPSGSARPVMSAGSAEPADRVVVDFDMEVFSAIKSELFEGENPFNLHDGLDLLSRFMDAGDTPVRRIVSGLLLDELLKLAVSTSPGLVLLFFQNLLNLALSTKHPSLMESVYGWMQGEPADLDLAHVIKRARKEAAKGGSKDVAGKIERVNAGMETIETLILRFVANQVATVAVKTLLQKGDLKRAQSAASFAARAFEVLCEVDAAGRAKHAVASQVCGILACNAACLMDHIDVGDWQPARLIASLDQRSSILRSDSKTVEALSLQAKLAALFIHIKSGSDQKASDALEEIRGTLLGVGVTRYARILCDILARLGPFMPLTLRKTLEISLEILAPEDPAYFDAVRALFRISSDKDTQTLIHQVHQLVESLPEGVDDVPPKSFVEWFYVQAWNMGARDIALKGMERHKLVGETQRALLFAKEAP